MPAAMPVSYNSTINHCSDGAQQRTQCVNSAAGNPIIRIEFADERNNVPHYEYGDECFACIVRVAVHRVGDAYVTRRSKAEKCIAYTKTGPTQLFL